jgi:hypothetical protein
VGNLFLGFKNRLDGATLSGGTWNATLPRSNLQTRPLWKVARTATATSSLNLDIDFGSAKNVRAIAIMNHNLPSGATWTVYGGTTSGGSQVYNGASLNCWQMTFDSDLIEFTDSNWWDGTTSNQYVRHPRIVSIVFSQAYSARYWRIAIANATTTETYLQFGRIWIGNGIVPTYNASYGLSDAWEDLSTVVESDDGATFAYPRRRRRVARFSLDWLTQSSEYAVIHEMQRARGTWDEVLYLPDSADAALNQRSGFLGRMRTLSPIEYPYPSTRSAGFELAELL